MDKLKKDLIHLLKNDPEIICELAKALDIEIIEQDIETLRKKIIKKKYLD